VTTADESDPWFRPVWEDEPADDGNGPPGMFARTGPGAVGGLDVPATLAPQLLTPVADASAALARLDARLEAADPAVADGLRARLALREACRSSFRVSLSPLALQWGRY
jgi:hypothetical protein